MGSGGRNASLAAILDGQGGQQKRQHSSENDRPIPLMAPTKRSLTGVRIQTTVPENMSRFTQLIFQLI